MAQKKYTTEYKLSIVDRVEKGESRNSISKKTGLSALTIKSWAEKKDQLIESLFEEAKNRKKTKRKKRGSSYWLPRYLFLKIKLAHYHIKCV